MGGNELLAALSNLTRELAPFWDLVEIIAYLAGAALTVTGFCLLAYGGNKARALASIVAGVLLLGVPGIIDAASQTLFQADAPKGLAVTSGSASGADRTFINFAVAVAMLTGFIGVTKSLIMISRIGSGSGGNFGQAATYFFAGIICINITTVIQVLGASIGGTFHEVVNRLLAGG